MKLKLPFRLRGADRETLLYKLLPQAFMDLAKTYFRVRVEGAAHLPRRGRALILPNHSGVSGFDAMVLQFEVAEACGRYPRVLTHHLWFLNKITSIPARRFGFVEATTENGLKALRKNQLVMLFPEGENGNFKPSSQAYVLQEFKRGFIRMALRTQSPIIPCLILGAEQTHINLSRLKFTSFLRGVTLPMPLNLIPLPSKWRIVFMEPIVLPYARSAADDGELVRELAEEVQAKMQERLNAELAKRETIFI